MQKRYLILAALAAFPLLGALPQPVRTDAGQVSGVAGSSGAVVAFKGIPYAAPPVGNLRWRPPAPAAPWQGVRKAAEYSDSCVQNIVTERKPWTHEFMAHNKISEDCLYLNVWTPASAATAKLPVMVWFHGGGLVEGSPAVPVYDGEDLARKGVVVVTVGYRLGVVGFLSHPELTKESEHKASGNYGFLDQRAALQWVQKNVAAFGGDPGLVTIFGQSAGSRSVLCQTASPLSKGLFHRAISESGAAPGRVSGAKLADAEQVGVKFAAGKNAKSLADLRKLTWQQLTEGIYAPGSVRFGPVVDGWFLPLDVDVAYAQGKQNDVPMISGWTADEASSGAEYGTIAADKWKAQIKQRFGADADAFLKLYPGDAQPQLSVAQKESGRDQSRVSSYAWASNRQKTAKTKVFTYYWTHAEPGPDSARYGAFHTSEVPYVFNSLNKSDRPWTAEDRKIAETMSSYWVNFAKNGDPNGQGLATWPAFDRASQRTMELGNKFAPRPVAEKAKLAFFEKYFSKPRPE